MRWGPSAQTDRVADLIFDEDGELGAPIELMLAPDPTPTDKVGKKTIAGAWTTADDFSTFNKTPEDQSITWDDWSLGMTFGRVDRLGRGGYSYGLGVDTRDPRRILPAGKVAYLTMPAAMNQAPIRDFKQYGSHVYCITGQDTSAPTQTSDILRIVDSDATVVVSARYQNDAAPYFDGHSLLVYRGYLYAGGYNGFMRRKLTDAADPDAGPLDDAVPGAALNAGWDSYAFQRIFLAKQNWTVAGIQDYYILANDTDNTMVYTTADPTVDGNWTSPVGVIQDDVSVLTNVGDSRYRIKSIATSNHRVWFGKTDGMWDLDSTGYAANATPFVEDALDETNCQASFYHNGKLVFYTRMGLMSMATNDRVRVDVPMNIQPGFGRPVEGPIYGEVPCNPTSDNGWLVVPIYNGRDSFLIYGAEPAAVGIDLTVPMLWHGALAHFPGRKITALGKTTRTGWPKLLIGLWDQDAEEATIASMYMLKSGSAYQSWQHDDDYRFQTDWSIAFTGEDLSLPNTRKALLKADAVSENTTTARKIEVYTAFDQTVWSEANADGDPFYVLAPPISGTYTLAVATHGTTASIAYDADAATIAAALAAVSGLSAANVQVSRYGEQTFKVLLVGLAATALLSVASGQASLAAHLIGTALAAPRSSFIPPRQMPTGFVLRVRADGHGTDTEPAILTSLKYRVSVIEDQLEEKEYTVRLGSGVTNRRGAKDLRDPLALILRLVALMNRGAIGLVNEHGRSLSVKVRSGLSYVQEEVDGGYEYRVKLSLKVQRQPAYWGAFIWNDSSSTWT